MAEIKLTRVDFRLIHGQIVVKWCKAFEVDKIVVIDNVWPAMSSCSGSMPPRFRRESR